MTDDEKVVEFTQNFLAQYEADLTKKQSITTQQTYEAFVIQLNAYYDTGVFDAAYTPDQAFAQVGFVFGTSGYPDLLAYINAQEGDGGWAAWPILLDATP